MTNDIFFGAIVIGVVATAIFDLCTVLQHIVIGSPIPNWGLLTRWIGSVSQGRLVLADNQSPVTPAQRFVGWCVHYLAGILFAGSLLLMAGPAWARNPTVLPALGAGIATLLLAWGILMPALGHGFAASKLPHPGRLRAINTLNHVVYGFGFYVGALLVR